MKAIRVGFFSFIACLAIGAAVVVIAPPEIGAGNCNFSCDPIGVCSGPVGTCSPPYHPYDNCYPGALLICDPEFVPYDCCVQIGCSMPC